MFIGLIVDEVHANNTGDVFLVAALCCRVLAQFGSSQHTSWCVIVVIMCKRIPTETLGDEPPRTVRLLPLYDEELQGHE